MREILRELDQDFTEEYDQSGVILDFFLRYSQMVVEVDSQDLSRDAARFFYETQKEVCDRNSCQLLVFPRSAVLRRRSSVKAEILKALENENPEPPQNQGEMPEENITRIFDDFGRAKEFCRKIRGRLKRHDDHSWIVRS